MSLRRILGTAVTTLSLLVPGVILAGPTSAMDPGFCGVRGESYWNGSKHQYEVRNKCSGPITVKVYLPIANKYARSLQHYDGGDYRCYRIPGGGTGRYIDVVSDRNWTVRNC